MSPSGLLQVAQLELADLDLVTVLESVRLDSPSVDVGAVERAQVVDVEPVLAPDQQSVVARDGHVVQEDPGVGTAPDRDLLVLQGEALPRATTAGADHHRCPGTLDDLVDVDRVHLPGLVDGVGHRRRLVATLRAREVRTALLAVVRALFVDETALWTVNGHSVSLCLP